MKITSELKRVADAERSKNLSRFFKTGKGQYGEGDIFLGVSVPQQHKIARKYPNLSLDEIAHLLESPIHECRLTGIFILVAQFKKAQSADQKRIYDFYFLHSKKINNWDLVDSSAHKIVVSIYLTKTLRY